MPVPRSGGLRRPVLLVPVLFAAPGVLLVSSRLLPGLGIFLLMAAILAVPIIAVLAVATTQWGRG